MDNENNQVIEDDGLMGLATSINTPKQEEITDPEKVNDNPDGTGDAPPANEAGESTDNPAEVVDDKPAEVEKPAFDLSKYLEEHSDGLLKSEEDFKASVAKIRGYETLEARVKELETEKEGIFANEEIKLLNQLSKEGKTDEQIDEFRKLRKLGDLSALDAKEILVQDLISKGTSKSVAEKLVEREYGLNSISLDSEELTDEELAKNKEEVELINERMKLDAEPKRKAIQERIDALSKPVDQTQQALAKVAAEKAYKMKLEPFVEKLANDFPSKIQVIEGVDFDVDPDYKQGVKSIALDYFMDKEVNDTSVAEFVNIQKAIYFAQNKEKIFKAVHDKGKEEGKTEAEAKFVNNNGLNRAGAVFNQESDKMSADDKLNYAMQMASD